MGQTELSCLVHNRPNSMTSFNSRSGNTYAYVNYNQSMKGRVIKTNKNQLRKPLPINLLRIRQTVVRKEFQKLFGKNRVFSVTWIFAKVLF